MRFIGNLPQESDAERFQAYMLTKGIVAHVESNSDQWEVWIKDEDHIPAAQTELANYLANPTDSQYENAVVRARSLAREEAEKRKRVQKNVVHMGGRWSRRKSIPMTIALVVICSLVTLLTNFGDDMDGAIYRALCFASTDPDHAELVFYAVDGRTDDPRFRGISLMQGQLWRLVTPIFLHYLGGFHLLMNMIGLIYLGQMIERRYSALWLGLLVLICAIPSNFMQGMMPEFLGGTRPGTIESGYLVSTFGGFSGVLYGFIGYIWMKMVFDRSSGLFVSQFLIMFALGWMFLGMTPLMGEVGGIRTANWAHGIGLLAGMATGYWGPRFHAVWRRKQPNSKPKN